LRKATLFSLRSSGLKDADKREYQRDCYQSSSFFWLLAGQPPRALQTAETGLKIDTSHLPLDAHRAHALLFLGRVAEAEEIYRRHIGAKMDDDKTTWERTILGDFDALEKAGVDHPEFPRLRTLLKAGKK